MKLNQQWFRVIGVAGPQLAAQTDVGGLPAEDRNNVIFVPLMAAMIAAGAIGNWLGEAALIRTLARYRQQTGLDPSQAVQEEALREYPDISRALVSLFKAKFEGDTAVETREPMVAELNDKIAALLQDVKSLDHDRALRRLGALIGAIKRTNYFQVDVDGEPKSYISIKIASRELEDLPLPKPYREIFIWAPHIEGVHLRFGPVARGGLRWSDRRDDFRTEVLGLVKAQQVKNAVIVPVGAKGGFCPKRLPPEGSGREAVLRHLPLILLTLVACAEPPTGTTTGDPSAAATASSVLPCSSEVLGSAPRFNAASMRSILCAARRICIGLDCRSPVGWGFRQPGCWRCCRC